MYDIDLFLKNIDYVVKHGDEPEMVLGLKDGTCIEFICYADFIDAYMDDDYCKYSSIYDFVDNLKIKGKSLRECWQDVVHIEDDLSMIDFSKTPEEQFCVGGSSIRVNLE